MIRRAQFFAQHRLVTAAAVSGVNSSSSSSSTSAVAAGVGSVMIPAAAPALVSLLNSSWDGVKPVDPKAAAGTGRHPLSHASFGRQVVELKRRHRSNSKSDFAISDARRLFMRCVPADAASEEFRNFVEDEENATLFLNGARFFRLDSDPAFATQIAAAEKWLLAALPTFSDKYFFVTGALTVMQIASVRGDRSHEEAESVRAMIQSKIVPRVKAEMQTYTLPMFEQALRLLTWLDMEDDKALWNAVADAVRARENQIGERISSMLECAAALIVAVPEHEVVKDLMNTLFTAVASMRSRELSMFSTTVEKYVAFSISSYSSASSSSSSSSSSASSTTTSATATTMTTLFAQVKELIGRWGVGVTEHEVDDLTRAFPSLARTVMALQKQTEAASATTETVAQVSELRDLMQVVLDDMEFRVSRFMDPTSPSEVYCGFPEDIARIMFAYESFGRSSSLSAVALFRSFAEYMEREFDATIAAPATEATTTTPPAGAQPQQQQQQQQQEQDGGASTARSRITAHSVSIALGVLSRTNCLSPQLATRCAVFLDGIIASGASRKPSDYFMALEEAGFCALALSRFAFASKQCAATVAKLQDHVINNWPATSSSAAAAAKDSVNSVPGPAGRRISIMGHSDHARSNAAVTTAISLSFVGGAVAEKRLPKILPAAEAASVVGGMRTLQLVQMWNAAALLQLVKAQAEKNAGALKKVQETMLAEIKARLTSKQGGVTFGAVELRMLCITSAKIPLLSKEIQACINSFLALQPPTPTVTTTATSADGAAAAASTTSSALKSKPVWISAACVDLLRFSTSLDKSSHLQRALDTARAFAVSGNQFVHLYHLLAETFPASEEVRAWGKKGASQLLKRDRSTAYALVELARRNGALAKGVVDDEFRTDLLMHVLPKARFFDFARTANAVALLAAAAASSAAPLAAEQKETISRVTVGAISHYARGGTVYTSSFTAADLLRDMIRGAEQLCASVNGEEKNPHIAAIIESRHIVQAIQRSGIKSQELKGTKVGAAEAAAAALKANDSVDAAALAAKKAAEAGAAAAASLVKKVAEAAAAAEAAGGGGGVATTTTSSSLSSSSSPSTVTPPAAAAKAAAPTASVAPVPEGKSTEKQENTASAKSSSTPAAPAAAKVAPKQQQQQQQAPPAAAKKAAVAAAKPGKKAVAPPPPPGKKVAAKPAPSKKDAGKAKKGKK